VIPELLVKGGCRGLKCNAQAIENTGSAVRSAAPSESSYWDFLIDSIPLSEQIKFPYGSIAACPLECSQPSPKYLGKNRGVAESATPLIITIKNNFPTPLRSSRRE
jgi:hypothetical protein